MTQIALLFSGREDLLMKRLEVHLIELYTWDGMTTEETVRVHFVISGAISTMQELSAGDKKARRSYLKASRKSSGASLHRT